MGKKIKFTTALDKTCVLQLAVPTTIAIVYSTPLVDLYDMEAEGGYTRKFRDFELHAAVNQLGLPLGAEVTLGNRYDGAFLPRIIEDLEGDYVLADGAYSSKDKCTPNKPRTQFQISYCPKCGNKKPADKRWKQKQEDC